MDLLRDLLAEADRARGGPPCPLCDLIRETPDEATQSALRDAAGGTLSERALMRVLTKNETGVGRRTVARHRSEGHTP